MNLRVHMDGDHAVLDWGLGPRRCAIGSGGIAIKGAEGDGITPRGVWPIREIFYRPDRIENLKTQLALWAIAPDDGWCDAPTNINYNRLVKLPYGASAEHMWRDDSLYDIVAVLGFNDDPVYEGKGSAIFLHLAKPDYAPTAGCIGLAQADLIAALEQLAPGDKIIID
jgi:L,D-peptidoglycan transpeptidase YkuD (ErfK/YbiS/YcfS/YnhG family)